MAFRVVLTSNKVEFGLSRKRLGGVVSKDMDANENSLNSKLRIIKQFVKKRLQLFQKYMQE